MRRFDTFASYSFIIKQETIQSLASGAGSSHLQMEIKFAADTTLVKVVNKLSNCARFAKLPVSECTPAVSLSQVITKWRRLLVRIQLLYGSSQRVTHLVRDVFA